MMDVKAMLSVKRETLIIPTAMLMEGVIIKSALLMRIAVQRAKDLSVLVMNALRPAKATRIVNQSVLI